MSKFNILIKSHTDYPDYEASLDAETIYLAADHFADNLNSVINDNYWNAENLLIYIRDEL